MPRPAARRPPASATTAAVPARPSTPGKTSARKPATGNTTQASIPADRVPVATDLRCAQAVAALRQRASAATRAGMTRYGIPNDKAFGVAMRDVQAVARQFGRDHALAEALWQTDLYDARMLACYVAEPAQVSAAQMERWVRDVDNWAHCDTVCFAVWDRTPHAWTKVRQWSTRKDEFVRRAAFALLASLTVHDKKAADDAYLDGLERIEAAAADERHFVKKAVNWALRSIGKRNLRLHAAAVTVAQRLAASDAAAPRWVGKDALRELGSAAVVKRLNARAAKG